MVWEIHQNEKCRPRKLIKMHKVGNLAQLLQTEPWGCGTDLQPIGRKWENKKLKGRAWGKNCLSGSQNRLWKTIIRVATKVDWDKMALIRIRYQKRRKPWPTSVIGSPQVPKVLGHEL